MRLFPALAPRPMGKLGGDSTRLGGAVMSLSGKFDKVRSGFGAVDHEAEPVHFRIRRRETSPLCGCNNTALAVRNHSPGFSGGLV